MMSADVPANSANPSAMTLSSRWTGSLAFEQKPLDRVEDRIARGPHLLRTQASERVRHRGHRIAGHARQLRRGFRGGLEGLGDHRGRRDATLLEGDGVE